MCLQNYHLGGKITLPDGITLVETAHGHMCENHLSSECAGSVRFSEVVALFFEPFLLLSPTLTGLFKR